MYVGCTRTCPFDQNGGRPVFTMILHLICSYLGRRDVNKDNGWGGVSGSTGEVREGNPRLLDAFVEGGIVYFK